MCMVYVCLCVHTVYNHKTHTYTHSNTQACTHLQQFLLDSHFCFVLTTYPPVWTRDANFKEFRNLTFSCLSWQISVVRWLASCHSTSKWWNDHTLSDFPRLYDLQPATQHSSFPPWVRHKRKMAAVWMRLRNCYNVLMSVCIKGLFVCLNGKVITLNLTRYFLMSFCPCLTVN